MMVGSAHNAVEVSDITPSRMARWKRNISASWPRQPSS